MIIEFSVEWLWVTTTPFHGVRDMRDARDRLACATPQPVYRANAPMPIQFGLDETGILQLVAMLAELDRVGQQIVQHLPQLCLVAGDGRQTRFELSDDPDDILT